MRKIRTKRAIKPLLLMKRRPARDKPEPEPAKRQIFTTSNGVPFMTGNGGFF